MRSGFVYAIAYILLAPFIGGFLEGVDRKISARMQRRVGPPLLQPFYDVIKLFNKETISVDSSQTFLLLTYFVLMLVTGVMFFSGSDILMCFFVLSTAATFLYFAGVITSSPYSSIGAQRELIQMMAYEPAVLLTCVGFYLAAGSFNVNEIASTGTSYIFRLPGFFAAFVFILTIKMRKSPFDTSTSHHMHQELVKGITTEMGSKNLALFQITEWYENVFLMGVICLFVVNGTMTGFVASVIVFLLVYFLEILIDNCSARMKWQDMLMITWIVTFFTAGVNLVILMVIK
ncbi:MAG: NADH-quinone oxidoreductase subunit H [Lachnospiraceae bacterium]|nr:NADH-quinone oxidoreductase subunit H [Lachnospiraceae bacterium]